MLFCLLLGIQLRDRTEGKNEWAIYVKTLPTSQREQVAKLVNLELYSLRESETYLSDYVAMRVTTTKVHGVIVQTVT